jgi:hypothetical protein
MESCNPRLGLRGVKFLKSTPNIRGMCTAKNMGKNFFGEGIDEKADHLLISGNPSIIGRVGYGHLFLVFIFSLKNLRRSRI